MEAKTELCRLDTELTLHTPSQAPLAVSAIILTFTQQDDELIECRLTFCVNRR